MIYCYFYYTLVFIWKNLLVYMYSLKNIIHKKYLCKNFFLSLISGEKKYLYVEFPFLLIFEC